MSYKPNESELIAYLYGEVSSEEKQRIEGYLDASSEAREEFEKLKETRLLLGKLSDKEVIEPVIAFEQSPATKLIITAERKIWKPLLAVAAAVALLMLIGYATNTSVSYHNSELKIAFGQPTSGGDLVGADLSNYIDSRIAQSENRINGDVNKTLVDLRADVSKEIIGEKGNQLVAIKQTISSGAALQQQELKLLAKQMQADNLKILADFVAASGENQQDYVDQLLVSFSTFFEERRIEDLRAIELTLQTLKEETDLKHEETGQILASIVNTVSGE